VPCETSPAHLRNLSQGEHMLVWGFRALAFGVGDCPLVRRQYEGACGVTGSEALNALEVFVRELARRGRRKVTLCVPGSYRLSRDEQLIVAIFAAAQAEDYARLEAHLAWLLADACQPPFPAAACLVAQAFAMNGLILRVPDMAPPPVGMETYKATDVVVPFRRAI
jgi:hypothetical protein